MGKTVTVLSHKQGIVLLGAGGHAKVIIDILFQMGTKVDYCIGTTDSANQCLGVSVLTGDEERILSRLYNEGYRKAFIGIGSNQIRLKLAEKAELHGFELINAISPHAVLSPSVKLGKGIAIMPGAVINADTVIEDLAIINTGATIDHDCVIDKAVHIAPQCGLAGCVSIGNRTFLGIGTKVIPGISIGTNTVIGAGSVIVRNIGDNLTCMGVPGKIVKENVKV